MSELIDKSTVLKRLCGACAHMGSFQCISCTIPEIIKAIPKIANEPTHHELKINEIRLIDANALHTKIYEDFGRNLAENVNIAQILIEIENAPTINLDEKGVL